MPFLTFSILQVLTVDWLWGSNDNYRSNFVTGCFILSRMDSRWVDQKEQHPNE